MKLRDAWSGPLARITLLRPGWILLALGLLSVGALALAAHLQMRMNWTDLLPPNHPTVVGYREIQDRFADPSITLALEGEREAMVAMAEELRPRLENLDALYHVQSRLPENYLLRHGLVLQKPRHFERFLESHREPSLVGTLRGLNDDYEREYSDSEDNLRRDEVEMARGLLGLARGLEIVEGGLSGRDVSPAEGVRALLVGEPWTLSLDRRMLLIQCYPVAPLTEIDEAMAAVEAVQEVLAEVAPRHPDVVASLTGMAKISQDEMESIGLYTQLLSLLALALIYILLARSFRGWLLPLIALAPLVMGLLWTMGLLQLLFGSLNIMTAMIMMVLLGLGVDFSIHFVSRFIEERRAGSNIEEALRGMLARTGTGVLTGGLTTAAAFFALTIADTRGVFEFGVASGAGVLLTLLAVFTGLPALLALYEKRREVRALGRGEQPGALGRSLPEAWPFLGSLAAASWRRFTWVLALLAIVGGASIWASRHTEFEYNFMELEPAGLVSVKLQRTIPERFGLSEQGAWKVAGSLDECRRLKEEFRELGGVAEVSSLADLLPPEGRAEAYAPRLAIWRESLAGPEDWDEAAFRVELSRLWDNLDLVGNLAYQAGLDRIVKVIDGMTGYDPESDATDSTAVLPRLMAADLAGGGAFADAFGTEMRVGLLRLGRGGEPSPEEVPAGLRRVLTARDGGPGYLMSILSRQMLWEKEPLDRFLGQVKSVDAKVVSTPGLINVMLEETLRDGREGSWLALAVIFVLLIVHFRGPRGLLAALPLLAGALIMLGLMYLFKMKYNYINLIAVPIILGIGIDDGVHALHRYREESGEGVQRVRRSFRRVGWPILLTSLTTMIGFGSVAFYSMRGMASFGIVLFMGVGACFLSTVLILPAVLRLFSRWEK